MKIKIFEIRTKKNKVYLELLEQYKTNPEVQTLLDESIIDPEMVLMGDLRLITTINHAIDMDDIKVYLVKDVDNDTFVWVIGKFLSDGNIIPFPLLKNQSKELQLAIRSALSKKGLIIESFSKNDI